MKVLRVELWVLDSSVECTFRNMVEETWGTKSKTGFGRCQLLGFANYKIYNKREEKLNLSLVNLVEKIKAG